MQLWCACRDHGDPGALTKHHLDVELIMRVEVSWEDLALRAKPPEDPLGVRFARAISTIARILPSRAEAVLCG